MKLTLWATISTALYLLVVGHSAVAQSPVERRVEQQPQCQLRNQQPLAAENTTDRPPSSYTLLLDEIKAMCQLNEQRPRLDDNAIATDNDPSPQHFTIPSLWWPQQQMGEAINNRLIDSWRAYDDTENTDEPMPHVDVVVNGQIWPLLNYLERYSFITQFGEGAKAYGYQLRIFTGSRLVGLHVCDFKSETSNPICAVELNYLGQGAIRGGRQR
ncbi:MAG: hypothetical protein AAGA46_06190 [Cyanobacteria bacterium P01_F01_bin.13]